MILKSKPKLLAYNTLFYPQNGYGDPRFQKPEIAVDIPDSENPEISNSVHPCYNYYEEYWDEWRATMRSDRDYVHQYLVRYSKRESHQDFRQRRALTPIPAYAKAAISEVKNAIFQRLSGTVRTGGPKTYQKAMEGMIGGVDLKGSSAGFFIGDKIILELLSMKKVGVLVENFANIGETVATKGDKHPYYCVYQAEDIRNWKEAAPESGREFDSVLLRHREYTYNDYGLPNKEVMYFKHYFINAQGLVEIAWYDDTNSQIRSNTVLNLREIPFVKFEISDSLLKEVSRHQIALMNIESSDLHYILKANFPFYTEQKNMNNVTNYLKNKDPSSDTCEGDNSNGKSSIDVGTTEGRLYGQGLERPGFIAPPTEPIKASMEKQEKLKADIRQLIHLAISNLQPTQQSAESKTMDQGGLEAGLSYIGLELEHGERQLGHYWALFEGEQNPTVNYPKRWDIKSDKDRQDRIEYFIKIRDEVPSLKFRKHICNLIVLEAVGNTLSDDQLSSMSKEILNANYISGDSATILEDIKAGLVSEKTGSTARGYNAEEELPIAREEHAARLARIKESQTSDPASRGVPDESGNLNAPVDEKSDKPGRGPA